MHGRRALVPVPHEHVLKGAREDKTSLSNVSQLSVRTGKGLLPKALVTTDFLCTLQGIPTRAGRHLVRHLTGCGQGASYLRTGLCGWPAKSYKLLSTTSSIETHRLRVRPKLPFSTACPLASLTATQCAKEDTGLWPAKDWMCLCSPPVLDHLLAPGALARADGAAGNVDASIARACRADCWLVLTPRRARRCVCYCIADNLTISGTNSAHRPRNLRLRWARS